MRSLVVSAVVVLTGITLVLGNQPGRYVIPSQDNVGVYSQAVRPLYDQALFVVSVDDRLRVIEQREECYRIQAEDGRIGWVEKRLVVPARGLTQMKFGQSVVTGYLDNPEPVVVLDTDDPLDRSIVLDRSFKDDLRRNIDRETVERSQM